MIKCVLSVNQVLGNLNLYIYLRIIKLKERNWFTVEILGRVLVGHDKAKTAGMEVLKTLCLETPLVPL